MSLYQKYRPKTFKEILTQDHVTKVLIQSLKEGNVNHAYLLIGTRGAGKTSIARIFSRALNCQDSKFVTENGEPCNKCESCLLSLSSSHPDIIEMDAASNRGIDEVRNLKESVDFIPNIGKFKVYIIDEVHMMTKEAFNALLKTLEEPPKHVVFILCTTEANKIPQTIISRSIIFELRNASISEIVSKLALMAELEKRRIDVKGLELIAQIGNGSYRDSESILEKVLASYDNSKITYENVRQVVGLNSEVILLEILEKLRKSDMLGLIETISNKFSDSQIAQLNEQLSSKLLLEIQNDLKSGKLSENNIQLFSFLTGLFKELHNSVNPKMIFIAKLLEYQSKSTNSIVVDEKKTVESISDDIRKKSKNVKPSKNPIEILGSLKKNKKATKNTLNILNKDQSNSLTKEKIINYFKDSKNQLYSILTNSDFTYENNLITVYTKKKMYIDHLAKQRTQELIQGLATEFNLSNLRIIVKDKESQEVNDTKKSVEELSDDDLKSIFM